VKVLAPLVAGCFAIAACGGGTASRDGGGGASGTAGFGGAGGSAGAGGSDPACASAVATQPCTTPGTFCGGESCTDVCQFCNVLQCMNGAWQPMESAPAPCWSCGDRSCQKNAQYCELTVDSAARASYRCAAAPAACQTALTCACLESQGIDATTANCALEGAGELLVVVSTP
jgi:hypothetical protein